MNANGTEKLNVQGVSWEDFQAQRREDVLCLDKPLYRRETAPTNAPKTNSQIAVIEKQLPATGRELLAMGLSYSWSDQFHDGVQTQKIDLAGLRYHFRGGRLTHAAQEEDHPVYSGVYCLTDGRAYLGGDGPTWRPAYKLGKADDLFRRIDTLSGQETFIGETLMIPYLWKTKCESQLETMIHRHLEDKKVSVSRKNGREWFLLSKTDLEGLNDWIKSL